MANRLVFVILLVYLYYVSFWFNIEKEFVFVYFVNPVSNNFYILFAGLSELMDNGHTLCFALHSAVDVEYTSSIVIMQ